MGDTLILNGRGIDDNTKCQIKSNMILSKKIKPAKRINSMHRQVSGYLLVIKHLWNICF